MATLREVRKRIAGVKKIQKITRAMKMVAAAKLRRAQMTVVAARPYARHLLEILQHLVSGGDSAAGSLFIQRPLARVAIVVVTADRGMCAAFNSNLMRAVERHIVAHYTLQPGSNNVTLFCIGRKGAEYFGRRGYAIAARHIGLYSTLVFAQAKAIAQQILAGYERGDYDRVEIAYNEFKSIAQQRIMIEQYLPVPAVPAEESTGRRTVPFDYIYEPSAAGILNALVPKHLDFQLWRVLLESNAAEQGARMAAMENATENAEELISMLQLHYNKARQSSITRELLEIVGGAEALGKAG
jgi:F-type H+-transporting ATPase subunit gamma